MNDKTAIVLARDRNIRQTNQQYHVNSMQNIMRYQLLFRKQMDISKKKTKKNLIYKFIQPKELMEMGIISPDDQKVAQREQTWDANNRDQSKDPNSWTQRKEAMSNKYTQHDRGRVEVAESFMLMDLVTQGLKNKQIRDRNLWAAKDPNSPVTQEATLYTAEGYTYNGTKRAMLHKAQSRMKKLDDQEKQINKQATDLSKKQLPTDKSAAYVQAEKIKRQNKQKDLNNELTDNRNDYRDQMRYFHFFNVDPNTYKDDHYPTKDTHKKYVNEAANSTDYQRYLSIGDASFEYQKKLGVSADQSIKYINDDLVHPRRDRRYKYVKGAKGLLNTDYRSVFDQFTNNRIDEDYKDNQPKQAKQLSSTASSESSKASNASKSASSASNSKSTSDSVKKSQVNKVQGSSSSAAQTSSSAMIPPTNFQPDDGGPDL